MTAAQVLLTCPAPGAEPLRFGFPIPEAKLSRGLRATGVHGLHFGWRRLQKRADPRTGRVWVELSLCGGAAGGRVRIEAGGGEKGAFRMTRSVKEVEGRREVSTVRTWLDGTVETERRIEFSSAQDYDGERFAAGEVLTLDCRPRRFSRAKVSAAVWRKVGVLPGSGKIGRRYRRHLLQLVPRLEEFGTLRDRGDYRRSRDVMTNLEFDTSLAFLRLGLAEGRPELLRRGLSSAMHSAERDLDPRTNLLHRHGRDHRSAPPEPGHTWLQGILLAGCLAADDRLLAAARRIAKGLSRRPAMGEGRDDRARDVGWPLLEMESWLRFSDDREVAAACASIVARLKRRFDDRYGVFRFGEGEKSKGVYEAPLWVTAGSLLPGLRAHYARTRDVRVGEMLRKAERLLSRLIRTGRKGVPVRAWMGNGKVFRVARVERYPSVFMVLSGLSEKERRRCLARKQVRDALTGVPAFDDPDLATSLSIVGRCEWVYR